MWGGSSVAKGNKTKFFKKRIQSEASTVSDERRMVATVLVALESI